MSGLNHLLDTNCCIYLLGRTRPSLEERVGRRPAGSVGISAIVGAELILGFAEADARLKALLERFLRVFPVAPFDEGAARAYARVPFRRGKLDRLLAAHALALDATLITNNVRDFADVPGLKVENWTLP
ncbi:MAG: type II toxin-antitoxin system VapC family toxin [Allosphingosinicella sp.]